MGLADQLRSEAIAEIEEGIEVVRRIVDAHSVRLLKALADHVSEANVWDAVGDVTGELKPDPEVRRLARLLECNTIADLMRRWEAATPAARAKVLRSALMRLEGQ